MIIKALPGLATGAKTFVTDGKAAYDAAKPIIAEGTMGFFNLQPPG